MPTPMPIIGTRISVTVLKLVRWVASISSIVADTTETNAKTSGMNVATNVRNTIRSTRNAAK